MAPPRPDRALHLPGRPLMPATLETLPVDLLDVDPINPRGAPGDVTDLAASIADIGIINPLIVRPSTVTDGRYGVLSGSRRLTAARTRGLEVVPALVHDQLDDPTALKVAVAENVGRKAMNPIEEARAFRRLLETGASPTQKALAADLGTSEYTVSTRLQLLDLPAHVQDRIAAGTLAPSAAYDKLRADRHPRAKATRRNTGRPDKAIPRIPADLVRRLDTAAAALAEPATQIVERAITRELERPSCHAHRCHDDAVGATRWCNRHATLYRTWTRRLAAVHVRNVPEPAARERLYRAIADATTRALTTGRTYPKVVA